MIFQRWAEMQVYAYDDETPSDACPVCGERDVCGQPCSAACEAELRAQERAREIGDEWVEDARKDREEGCE